MQSQIAHELTDYTVALEPDRDEYDWWAGAPSVARSRDGRFFLAARMREATAPRGRRGYEIRILESEDGLHFRPIRSITKHDAGLYGFERPALLANPESDTISLYGCGEMDDGWGIWRLDDAVDPRELVPATLRPVLAPRTPFEVPETAGEHHGIVRVQYKDPFIIRLAGELHMFVIGFDRVERPYHFVSADGEAWEQVGGPILENAGWHNFYTRPASLLPLPVGHLLVYEGSSVEWFDPAYNIATGLAYSLDLRRFVDITPAAPLLMSTTPGDYHTWRYSHWMHVDDKVYVYYEAARPNGTNELRVSVLEGGVCPA